MSIRLLAIELYRVLKEVDRIKAQIDSADLENRTLLEEKLRKKKAEEIRLRRALDGMKDATQA